MWPWAVPALANWCSALAVIGLVRLAASGRSVFAALLLAYWPYLVFHATFQETLTLRYALPVVVPVAGLAVIALTWLRERVAAVAAGALVAASLVVAQPRLEAYAGDGSPVFRAFQDMMAALPAAGAANAPVLRMQHQVWWGVQRVMDWYRPSWDIGPQPHPGSREWLALVRRWLDGDTRPVWFLTDVTRTDVALFDRAEPDARRTLRPRPDVRALMRRVAAGPARLVARSGRPAWMLGTGWSLTPEVAGMTTADGTSPNRRDADAFLLRGTTPLRVLIGGRYLGAAGQPGATMLGHPRRASGRAMAGHRRPELVRAVD